MTKLRVGLWVAGLALGVTVALVFPRQETRAAQQAGEAGAAAREPSTLNRRLEDGPRQKTVVIRTGLKRALQTDPRDPDYDPVVLDAVYDKQPVALFSAEPRDEGFAIPRESMLRDQVTKDLAAHFPDARVDAVVCHTSSCQVTVQTPTESLLDVYGYIQHPALGATQQIASSKVKGAPQDTKIVLTILFSRAHRDHVVHGRWYKKHRAETIAALKEVGWLVPNE